MRRWCGWVLLAAVALAALGCGPGEPAKVNEPTPSTRFPGRR
jgi:hypothetical protein